VVKKQKPDIVIPGTRVARGDEPRREDYPSSSVELTISFAPMPARVKPKGPKPKRLKK
jgi:hypothetical protein